MMKGGEILAGEIRRARVAVVQLLLLLVSVGASGQWSDHFSYASPTMATTVGEYMVVSNDVGAMVLQGYEVTRLTKVNHLSDGGITAIGGDKTRLYVGYDNGNIDIVELKDRVTTNIPELKNSQNIEMRKILSMTAVGNRLLCGSQCGLVDIDIRKAEIRGIYKFDGGLVRAATIADGQIYAATANGLYVGKADDPILEDLREWKQIDSGECQGIAAKGDNSVAYVVKKDGSYILRETKGGTGTKDIDKIARYTGMSVSGDLIAITETDSIIVYNGGKKSTTLKAYTSGVSDGVIKANAISWKGDFLVVADQQKGLVVTDLAGKAGQVLLDGPGSNTTYRIGCAKGVLYATAGGTTEAYNNLWKVTEVYTMKDGRWADSKGDGVDATDIAIDPNAGDSVYISTWGSGIFKVEGTALTEHYNGANSVLKDIFGGTNTYVRTKAIAYDNDHNLVVFHASMPEGIKVKTADNEWHAISYPPINELHSTEALVFTENGNGWAVLPRVNQGLFVFNMNGTIEDDSDDVYMSVMANDNDRRCKGQIRLIDGDGELISNVVTSVAVDRDGVVWVGSDNGICRFTDDKHLFDGGTPTFSRVKVPRNDGTDLADYLLDGVTVKSIAVDGANRKWIGTYDQGVYVVSSDGLETDHTFNVDNSPLISNEIIDIAIDDESGEVYISTPLGLQSYRGEATGPAKKLEKIKVYPNPIRHGDSPGYVSMTGFEDGSRVIITDASGVLVRETVSLGGRATWDLRRPDGSRASAGIYIVWATNGDGTNKAIGKIMVK